MLHIQEALDRQRLLERAAINSQLVEHQVERQVVEKIGYTLKGEKEVIEV